MSRINGPLRHTFTGTGRSPTRFATRDNKTMILNGTDAFAVSAEVSYDEGVTWTVIEDFITNTVKNFEWLGQSALISFNCTSFTSNDVDLVFE